MIPKLLVFAGVCAYFVMSCSWFLLAWAQWQPVLASASSLPLVVMLLLMLRLTAVVFFYAALLVMPYLATAITQLLIAQVARTEAIICLAAGLVYLALLALVLRALKHRASTLSQ
ncbi:MAG: hypothetical protein HKN70_07275 [Gammaproteobacteria bacterium]|nr:hypothetical protein [Gammaproteobacteria bacterium]